MLEKFEELQKEIESISITNNDDLENFRLKYLSKKGVISQLFSEFKNISVDQKKVFGQKINFLKQFSSSKYNESKSLLAKIKPNEGFEDYTIPSEPIKLGTRHPISTTRREILDIFFRIGYSVSEGPEIEDDWHVFSGLNFPEEHPARDMQDTFFISTNPDHLLRTHTSSVQVREMENNDPPIRKLFPGRVFRNEAISARSHCIFHQVEGLLIDTNISFADLKQTLGYFSKEFFGPETKIRLRPSYFPFTEPSAELDVSCSICGGKGCNVCKYTGFLEIMGCGMVDPSVLANSNIDNQKYTGFAFGMGIERIAMLKYRIKDIRYLFENDVRFLQQFEH